MNSTKNITYSEGSLPTKFPFEYRIVATILHVIIFCLGVVGNIATIHIVRKTKSMHTPTYCYLVSLAVADLMVLLSTVPEAIISHHLYQGQWVLGQAGCSILVFLNFLGINASSTSICAFTIERYIGICHPLWAQKICSVGRAKKIIIGIWLFAVIYCSHWLGLTLIRTHIHPGFPELQQCSYRLPRNAYVYMFLADISLFYVIPLIIAIVLYTRIGLILRDSIKGNLRKNLATAKHGLKNITSGKDTSPPAPPKDNSLIQVVRMLVVVVTSFAILWLPYRGLLVYNSFSSKKFLNVWYLLFAKTSIYLNSAINPVLYSIMSKKFREALLGNILPFITMKQQTHNAKRSDTATTELNSAFGKTSKEYVEKGSTNVAVQKREVMPLLPVQLGKDLEEWNKIIVYV